MTANVSQLLSLPEGGEASTRSFSPILTFPSPLKCPISLRIRDLVLLRKIQLREGEVRGLGLFKLAWIQSGFADFFNPQTFWVLRGAEMQQCGPVRQRAGIQAHLQCVTESEIS